MNTFEVYKLPYKGRVLQVTEDDINTLKNLAIGDVEEAQKKLQKKKEKAGKIIGRYESTYYRAPKSRDIRGLSFESFLTGRVYSGLRVLDGVINAVNKSNDYKEVDEMTDKFLAQTTGFRSQISQGYEDLLSQLQNKKTSEEWAKYEQEHAQQTAHAQLDSEEAQIIAKNQEILLSQLYQRLGGRTDIRLGIEEQLNEKLPDNHFVGELFESWGLSPIHALTYCIGKRHAEAFSEIEIVSQEMQNQIKEGKYYQEDKILYLNQLLDHIKDIKKENAVPGIGFNYTPEVKEKLAAAHETIALYGTKCLELICNEDPRNILRDDVRQSFKRIKNTSYKNAINISSIALSAELIKAISNADDKYQAKTNEFTPHLLREQDRLYSLAQKAAEHPNLAIFHTKEKIIEGGLLGALLVESGEINTKVFPICSDNSESYMAYKREFENISRNYSEILEEDEEGLKRALNHLESAYAIGEKNDLAKCIIKDGKARILPTEQELTELSDIYTKLIKQSAEKAREAVKKKDGEKAREYLNMARELVEEKRRDVDSLLELVRPKESTRCLESKVNAVEERPKPNFLDNLPAKKYMAPEIQESPDETPEHMRPEHVQKREQIKREMNQAASIYEKYHNGMALSHKHSLSPEEAYQRASNLLGELQKTHAGEIKDTRISWNEDKTKMNFSLKVKGIPVEGEAQLIGNEIVLGGKLPGMAKLFKGKIERAIREELEKTFN